jgi:hypothetical protein
LKLPVLVEHYLEHKSTDKSLSFLDFLALHYNQAFDHDSTDSKLPFKSQETNCSINIIATLSPNFVLSISKTDNYAEKQKSVYHKNHFIASVISTIWQPPRV